MKLLIRQTLDEIYLNFKITEDLRIFILIKNIFRNFKKKIKA
jgi:hypothetical protein